MPPVTPAPSRFLISKRPSTQKSQSQTPNQQNARESSQFHVTPRFAASTPRPSATQSGVAFATPALAIKSRVPRTRPTQDIIDDSSPVDQEDGSPSAPPTTRNTLPEPIEIDSSQVPQSPFQEEYDEGRAPKRRRISIASSEPETDPVVHSQHSVGTDFDSLPDAPDAPDAPDDHIVSYHSDLDDEANDVDSENDHISPTQSLASSPIQHRSRTVQIEEEEDDDDDSHPDTSDNEPNTPGPEDTKPTITTTKPAKPKPAAFHAPRFKPTEPPDKFESHADTAYLNADIFSPQRRGTKYLAGGLAAELRDWLVEVKGGVDGEGEVKACSALLGFGSAPFTATTAAAAGGGGVGTSGTVRIVVDEVERGGVGMTLVYGRLLVNGTTGLIEDGKEVRVILAGEGNIEGLGAGAGKGSENRGRVGPGAVVYVAAPAWDVELDEQWAVAYRWEVANADVGEGV